MNLQHSSAALLLWLACGEARRKKFQPFEFDESECPLVLEQFDGDKGLKWIGSESQKRLTDQDGDGTKQPSQQFRYSKDWAIEEATVYPGFEGDKGLVLKSSDQYYAISAVLPRPITFGSHPIVIQYETKFQEGVSCGGAYMKLFRAPLDAQAQFAFRPERTNDQTPFSIMFGPDRCESRDKVHFIIQHLNRKTGQIQEKSLKEPPMIRSTKLSSLYTLIVRPDGSFDILINREIVRTGHLHLDFDPPLNTPAHVDDPEDIKPSTWVDVEKIPDPTAVKPIDWDESIPPFIEDSAAKKPEGWLENEPGMIPDPESRQPPVWNEKEDGVWEAPLIINPKCNVGCGKWLAPLKKNPLYKGKWSPPLIDNPAYRGPWSPRQIPNPEHFIDKTPSAFLPAIGIGFELYTMQGGVMIDNLIIIEDEDQASRFAEATWTPKYDIERLALEAELQAQGISDEPILSQVDEFEDNRHTPTERTSLRKLLHLGQSISKDMSNKYSQYWSRFRKDPHSTILQYPVMTVNMALLSLTVAYLCWIIIFLVSERGGGVQNLVEKTTDRTATIQSIVKTRSIADIDDMTLCSPGEAGESGREGSRMRRVPNQLPLPASPVKPFKQFE